MKTFLRINKSTGEVIGAVGISDPNLASNIYHDPDTEIVEEMPPLDVHLTTFVSDYYKAADGTFAQKPPKPDGYYVWSIDGWVVDLPSATEWLRNERDYRLGLSDWTQLVDAPLSPSVKAEWGAYRQQLRDMPTSYQTPEDFANVVWPNPPL